MPVLYKKIIDIVLSYLVTTDNCFEKYSALDKMGGKHWTSGQLRDSQSVLECSRVISVAQLLALPSGTSVLEPLHPRSCSTTQTKVPSPLSLKDHITPMLQRCCSTVNAEKLQCFLFICWMF